MAETKYSLGGTEFDAVPETMRDLSDLPIREEATIGRGMTHRVGVGRNTIVLEGRYISAGVKSGIDSLFEACESLGATTVFNDGVKDRNVLIRSFTAVPIVGKTEGYSFRLELSVISEEE
ncbi:MAG: hypothetical protein ABIC40_05235 [bacterium]